MVSGEYLGDTSMGNPELSRDVTGSDPHLSQLNDPDTDLIGKGSSVDKDPSQLVDFSICSVTGVHHDNSVGQK